MLGPQVRVHQARLRYPQVPLGLLEGLLEEMAATLAERRTMIIGRLSKDQKHVYCWKKRYCLLLSPSTGSPTLEWIMGETEGVKH